jgi:hypothetical protein
MQARAAVPRTTRMRSRSLFFVRQDDVDVRIQFVQRDPGEAPRRVSLRAPPAHAARLGDLRGRRRVRASLVDVSVRRQSRWRSSPPCRRSGRSDRQMPRWLSRQLSESSSARRVASPSLSLSPVFSRTAFVTLAASTSVPACRRVMSSRTASATSSNCASRRSAAFSCSARARATAASAAAGCRSPAATRPSSAACGCRRGRAGTRRGSASAPGRGRRRRARAPPRSAARRRAAARAGSGPCGRPRVAYHRRDRLGGLLHEYEIAA